MKWIAAVQGLTLLVLFQVDALRVSSLLTKDHFSFPRSSTSCHNNMCRQQNENGDKSKHKDQHPSTQLIQPLILGGGLAGVATALALQRLGPDVVGDIQLWEASSEAAFYDSCAGAGAQLGPNGLRALKAIGDVIGSDTQDNDLYQKVRAAGTALEGNVLLLPHGSMVIPDTAQEDTGLPQVFVRWGILRQLILNDLLSGSSDEASVHIHTNSGRNVAGYRHYTDEHGVPRIQLVDTTGDDINHAPCNLLIGAEGVSSVLRYLVNTHQTIVPEGTTLTDAGRLHLQATGRVNYKAIVSRSLSEYILPGSDESDDNRFRPNHTYGWFAPSGGVACFCGPAGAGHSYWAVSVAEDTHNNDKANNPKEALLSLLHDLGSDDDTSSGCSPYMLDLIADTDATRLRVTPSEETTGVGPSLVADDVPVVLVGDSAHAMSLSYGQNSNLALEDAAVLAFCLQKALRDISRDGTSAADTASSVQQALTEYSALRIARCQEMQRRSDERARKAMKGEQAEDVTKWIFQWRAPGDDVETDDDKELSRETEVPEPIASAA